MSLSHSPSIVTSGLVLCVDAGNTKSYPGSGTSWSDLSQSKITGTLTNSPTFTSGSISLNGTNQFVNFGTQTLGVSAANKTMCAWIFPTSIPNNPTGILDMDGTGSIGGVTNFGWGFWLTNGGKLWYWPLDNLDIIDSGSLSVSTNTWNFVSIAYNVSTKTADFYYNGVYSASGTTTAVETAPATGQNLIIGAIRNNVGGNFAGRISNVSLYNRVLSRAEVQQNFNALRGRHGI